MKLSKMVIVLMIAGGGFAVAGEAFKDQIKFGNEAARQNLWAEARFRWQKVLSAEPGNGVAHNNLGVALEREGKIEEAVEHYRLAVKALPENEYARKNLQRCEELLKTARGTKEGAKS